MRRRIKFGKAAIVVFLTALIWVWADLAQDETFTVPHATITITKSIDPSLWVTFGEAASITMTMDDIVLRGPASKIADVEHELSAGTLTFAFFLDPLQVEMLTTPGKHLLDLQSFVRNSKLVKDRRLTVESCSPTSITVMVVKLVEKSLKVRCIDEDGAIIKDADIDSPHVKMFVPEDWAGERLIADVPLTSAEVNQARAIAINAAPQIELAPGRLRKASTTVRIRMPREDTILTSQTITGANLAIGLSVNLVGRYKPEVTNLTDVVRPFTIKATLEAKQAYERQPFQMTLHILDSDEKVETEQTREVVYNLPEEFVRKDQIMPPPVRAKASFKLILLDSGKGPSTVGS